MRKFVFLLLNPILILNVGLSYSQDFKVEGLENMHTKNSFSMYLAAVKLCDKYYSENDMQVERNNKSSYKKIGGYSDYGCHLCVEMVHNRHANSFELFVDRFLNDKRIQKNRTNAFKVRSLREEIKENYYEHYKKLVDSTDTENLVFYKYDLISGYSFDTNELYINMFFPKFNALPAPNKGKLVLSPNLKESHIDVESNLMNGPRDYLGSFKIPVTEARAQEIYDRYKNHFAPNPPFGIGAKLYYALRLGNKLNGQIRNFQVVLKKAEFFLPDEEDIKYMQRRVVKVTDNSGNKFAEIIFNENLNYTEIGYPYQEIVSQKVYN